MGSVGLPPVILKLSTRWRPVTKFTPQPLHPHEKSPVYMKYVDGGPHSRSGSFGGKETILTSISVTKVINDKDSGV